MTTTTITENILRELQTFIHNRGIKPDTIYLGRNLFTELQIRANYDSRIIVVRNKNMYIELVFYNISVIEVLKYDYIGFGLNTYT